MALDDPYAPYGMVPDWDEAAFLDAVTPKEPIAAPEPLNVGAPLGGPTVAEELAQRPDWQPGAPPPWEQTPVERPTIEMPDEFVGKPEVPDLPPVDAISGVDQPPPPEAFTSTGPIPTEKPLESLTDEEFGLYLAGRPAEEQAIFKDRHDRAREDFRLARMEQEAAADRKRADDNYKIEQRARDENRRALMQVREESQKLADTPIDQDAWMESRSPLQKIAAFTAAIVGGLASGSTGGRNMGLEAIQRQIDQHIDIQRATLAAKRQALGDKQASITEQYALDMEDSRRAETYRQAMYEQAIRGLEGEVQKFDPRGATAIRISQNIGDLRARQAQGLSAWEQKNFENNLKLGEFALKQEDALLKRQQAEAKMRADAIRASGAGAAAKAVKFEDTPLTADQLRGLGVAIPTDAVLPPGGLSLNQARKLSETAKSAQDWQKATRENSPEEISRTQSVGELVDDQGDDLKFRDPAKVATLKGAADFGVQLLDRLKTSYEQYGWSSDLLKSPEWQRAQSDLNQYMLEKKNIDALGVLAGPDLELIKGTMGATNVTGIRDPGPGLSRARDNVVEKLNSMVRAEVPKGSLPKGRSIKRWEPPAPAPPAPKTPEQGTIETLLKFNPKTLTSAESKELGGIGKVLAGAGPSLPPSYAKAIDRLVGVFHDRNATEKEQQQAGTFLKELQENAVSEAVRAYASKAATGAAISTIPTSGDL